MTRSNREDMATDAGHSQQNRVMTSNLVAFAVGPSKVVYHVPKAVLRERSLLFRAQLDDNPDACITRMEYFLENERWETFAVFESLLLCRNLINMSHQLSASHQNYDELIVTKMRDAHHLARSLGLEAEANVAVEFVGREYARWKVLPTIEVIRSAYCDPNRRLNGSGLRRLMARYLVQIHLTQDRGDEVAALLHDYSELSQNFLRITRDAFSLGDPMRLNHPESDQICIYHSHTTTAPCHASGHRFDCECWRNDYNWTCEHQQNQHEQTIDSKQDVEWAQTRVPQSLSHDTGGDIGTEGPLLESRSLPGQVQSRVSTANPEKNTTEHSTTFAPVDVVSPAAERISIDAGGDSSMNLSPKADGNLLNPSAGYDQDDEMSDDEPPHLPRRHRTHRAPTRILPTRPTRDHAHRRLRICLRNSSR